MKVPSRAEPSWGTLISELKPSWTKFFKLIFSPRFYYQKSCIMISAMISINFIIIYLNFCVFKGENLIQIHNLVNFIIENNKKIGLQLRIEISARFSVNFQFRAEVKKVTSRAEPSWKSFSSSYGSSQLGSGSSLIFTKWCLKVETFSQIKFSNLYKSM